MAIVNLTHTGEQLDQAISNVLANYVDTSDATALASEILNAKTAYVNGVKVTGSIPSKSAATFTPTTSAQEIAAGQYLSGKQTIGAIPSTFKDMATTDVIAANVLSGKKAGNTTGIITGTMPNIGTQTATISTKAGTVTPTQGYHNGLGQVEISDTEQAKIISGNIKLGVTILGVNGSLDASGIDTSDATAAVGEILNTKTAYVNGVKITGSMPNIGAQTTDISAKATSVTPTAGYHNGSGVIKIATAEQDKIITGNIKSGVTILGVAGATNVVDTTNAVNSATDATLLSGKKAFVNGESRTGTMPNIGQQKVDISAKATSVTPTAGYHNGSGVIKIATAEQDKIISGNIKLGVTILGVNGSLDASGIDTSDATAAVGEILDTKTAYVNGVKITGTMPNIGAQNVDISVKATSVTPTQGYHNGAGAIKIATAEQNKIITGNIKSGVTILGVNGATNVIDTTNAADSATTGNILNGKKAFVNGALVTGNILSKGAATITPTVSEQEIAAGQYLSGKQTIAAIPSAYKDTTGTDAVAANILSGKKAVNTTGQITGNMTNVGAQTATISTKAGTVTPTQGYHNGLGQVSISAAEQAKIIAGNIKSGVTILGQAGSVEDGSATIIGFLEGSTVEFAIPTGATEIRSNAFAWFWALRKIWIPSTVTDIMTSSWGDSPFKGCIGTCVIYCEAASKPAMWEAYWNYYSSSGMLTVNWGVTKSQYDAL